MRRRSTASHSCAAEPIARYVAAKRALKRHFHNEEKALCLLDRFVANRGVERIEDITPELIGEFLASRPRERPRSYNHLLCVVRGFFTWLVAQGELTTSPVQAKPRRATSRRTPFIVTPDQARRLFEAAENLPDCGGVTRRGITFRTIFTVLYGLGLRVGEVSRLRREDVDLDRALLVVRESKFSKSRLVPFGPQIRAALERYVSVLSATDRAATPDEPIFSCRKGQPISAGTISQTFHRLWEGLGVEVPVGVAPARLHDLRHSFAVRTLLRWYRQGVDPSTRLLHLATFLGHVNPTSTAEYLTITTELLDEASQRFERFASAAVERVKP